jgi:hypothetical protein
MMEPLVLSFGVLLGYLQQSIECIQEPRQPSNGTRYRLGDAILAAFSMFFMQCESFLEHQRQMQSRRGKDNAQTLFGLNQIPSVPQIRNILDQIGPQLLFGVFERVYSALQQGGYLKPYQCLGGHLLVTLDGTQYFSSQKLGCDRCSTRTHKNGRVTYFHSAILPVIVAPTQTQVIALAPEFIRPQDGCHKQDCELEAAKRWLQAHAKQFDRQPITLLGDDLYSHQPLCQQSLELGMNFIFTALPASHPALYERLHVLDVLGAIESLETRQDQRGTPTRYRYRYTNLVPIRDTPPALLVNWCELTVTDERTGQVLYHNAFITHHRLNDDTVVQVVAAGRSRWKTENENHNVLKTKGYHLEHNFGHGQQHLAAGLLTLNLLAFLFHTVLQLVDTSYQQIRQQRGTRKGFFQDILSLTKYLLFESWQHLIDFMLADSDPVMTPNSS